MVLPAFAPAAPYVVPTTMLDVVKHLGLPSPKLCLDAGDINSVASGSQTKWLDVSGNGYDFFRGSDATSQTSDPTFNGPPGGQSASEFYGFDGGDFFAYDSANETWMQNIHKDGAAFTILGWVYVAGGSCYIISDESSSTSEGCFNISVTGGTPTFRLQVLNTSGNALLQLGPAVTLNTWTFFGVTVEESAGTGTWQGQSTQSSFTSTYSSPLSTNSSSTIRLGAPGAGSFFPNSFLLPNGSRMNSIVIWEGTALSAAQLDAVYQGTKAKFGL